jgi:hypothetical protein
MEIWPKLPSLEKVRVIPKPKYYESRRHWEAIEASMVELGLPVAVT